MTPLAKLRAGIAGLALLSVLALLDAGEWVAAVIVGGLGSAWWVVLGRGGR